MKVSSFKSLNGTTWVLSEGFCVLGYFKSRRAAREERARRLGSKPSWTEQQLAEAKAWREEMAARYQVSVDDLFGEVE
jgi:hypothetical protein